MGYNILLSFVDGTMSQNEDGEDVDSFETF